MADVYNASGSRVGTVEYKGSPSYNVEVQNSSGRRVATLTQLMDLKKGQGYAGDETLAHVDGSSVRKSTDFYSDKLGRIERNNAVRFIRNSDDRVVGRVDAPANADETKAGCAALIVGVLG